MAIAYAEAVINHSAMDEFASIPMSDFRADKAYPEPDYSENGMRATEAHVLAALLPLASRVAAVRLDGETAVPVRKFRGGKPSDVEAGVLKAAEMKRGALALIHSGESNPLDAHAEDKADDGAALTASLHAYDGSDEPPEEDIDLTKASLGVGSAVIMASLLAKNTTLLSLNLNYNKLGTEGAVCLARGLKSNGSLVLLSLAWNRILPEGAAAIATALHGNKSITSLNLACNELCGVNSFGQGAYKLEGMSHIASLLSTCEVRCLDLSNNSLVGLVGMSGRTMGVYNVEALDTLAKGMPGSKVDALVLDGNQIGAEGVGLLSAALERHTSLTSLYLADCNLTNGGSEMSGLTQFVACLKKQSSLKELNLDGCHLGTDGSQLLASWLNAKSDAFEHLFVERASNQLDSASEDVLKTACGDDVMLHLERGRPQYQASLDKSEGLIRNELKRRASVDAARAMPTIMPTPKTGDDPLAELGLTPSPPGSKKPPGGRHGGRHRRGSTGSASVPQ